MGKKANIFGYPVYLGTKAGALAVAIDAIQNAHGLHVVTINPEIIAAADKDPLLSEIIKRSGLVIPESTGVFLAIRSLGAVGAEKIPGIEFSESLLEWCAKEGRKVGFLGGAPGVIEEINFPGLNIVFARNGYFKDTDEDKIIRKLQDSQPEVLLVGLGCPKQDYFINKLKETLPHTVMIGVGGSFDVWAKKVKRAPILYRAFGLEWFYRLITQPQRFNRMFPVLPLFFLRILFDRKNLYIIPEN